MTECGNTFDGLHHWGPREFGARQTGNLREVIACVCGAVCPERERPLVEIALKATADERSRQRALAQRLTSKNAPAGQPRLL